MVSRQVPEEKHWLKSPGILVLFPVVSTACACSGGVMPRVSDQNPSPEVPQATPTFRHYATAKAFNNLHTRLHTFDNYPNPRVTQAFENTFTYTNPNHLPTAGDGYRPVPGRSSNRSIPVWVWHRRLDVFPGHCSRGCRIDQPRRN